MALVPKSVVDFIVARQSVWLVFVVAPAVFRVALPDFLALRSIRALDIVEDTHVHRAILVLRALHPLFYVVPALGWRLPQCVAREVAGRNVLLRELIPRAGQRALLDRFACAGVFEKGAFDVPAVAIVVRGARRHARHGLLRVVPRVLVELVLDVAERFVERSITRRWAAVLSELVHGLEAVGHAVLWVPNEVLQLESAQEHQIICDVRAIAVGDQASVLCHLAPGLTPVCIEANDAVLPAGL
mmetsp:Transcript_11844/g.42357  ORF Transcript_11844/g.42357 Transcript_11844/m.42357 type:complete len:243 (+) Transcript_11844:1270-1998(+)